MEGKRKAPTPLVDIHHHLIYGMDDGAQTGKDMCRMLQRAYLEGVRHVIATPHAEPGQSEFAYAQFLRRLDEAQRWLKAQKLPMKLYPGCEIFYTDAAPRLLREKRIPTLAGSQYVLVEFSPMAPYSQLLEAAGRLQNAGYQPVYAHVERYRCLNRLSRVRELHDDYHVLLQMNAGTIIDRQGLLREAWKKRVLENGWIDIAASDAHNTAQRVCRMGACYQTLAERYGRRTADRLCCRNAAEILRSRQQNHHMRMD